MATAISALGAAGAIAAAAPARFRVRAIEHGTLAGDTAIIHVDPARTDEPRYAYPLVTESEARSLEVRGLIERLSPAEQESLGLPNSDDPAVMSALGLIGGLLPDHVLLRRTAGMAGAVEPGSSAGSANDTISATAWENPRYVHGGTIGADPLEADVDNLPPLDEERETAIVTGGAGVQPNATGGTVGHDPDEADQSDDGSGGDFMPFADVPDDQLSPQQKGAQTRWRAKHPA